MKDLREPNQDTKQQDDTRTFNMRLLLNKPELLHQGGLGLQTLFTLSLRDIMVRWVNLMVERAAVKLSKIIDIIEKEVSMREYHKLHSREDN